MEKAYAVEIPGEKKGDLFVNCCGISKTEPKHYYGPAVKPHYIIHYIISGKGIFTIGGREYPLKAGYGFLITPDELSYYRSDDDEPLTYVWVGFGGAQAGQYVKTMGLSAETPIFDSDRSDDIYQVIQEMVKYNTCELKDELGRNGLLSVFLSIVADNRLPSVKSEPDRATHYVRKAIEFILCNYCSPIKITEVADYVCINRSYLYTLFMNTIDISPHQFLATYRIAKAAELLQHTNLPIESVALSCGYMDSLVFTKAFKQMKSISPSVYRKSIRNGDVSKSAEHLKQVEEFISHIKKLDA